MTFYTSAHRPWKSALKKEGWWAPLRLGFLGFAKPANPNRAWICWTCFIVTPVNNETNNIKSTLQPTHMKELSLRNNGLLSRTVIFFLDFFRRTRNRSRRRGAATNLSPSQKSEREWRGLKQRRTALYLNPSTPSHLVRAWLSKYTLRCWPQEGTKAQTLPHRLCAMAAAVVTCVVLMHPNSF